MEFQDKVVIVTGASSGIGRALAAELARRGTRLALVSRGEEMLAACAAELPCGSDRVAVVPADVRDGVQCSSAVAATFDRFGRIDALVNSAGVGYFGAIERMSLGDLEAMMQVNVYGLLRMTQAAIPHLKDSKGMIVNISSSLSKRALPYLSAYGGSKAMVDHLSDGLRMELAPAGVHVLNYCPPETETEFDANSTREQGMERGEERRARKPAGDVARRIAQAMAAGKREVVEGTALKWMDVFAPRRADAMFVKAMVEPAEKRRSSAG